MRRAATPAWRQLPDTAAGSSSRQVQLRPRRNWLARRRGGPGTPGWVGEALSQRLPTRCIAGKTREHAGPNHTRGPLACGGWRAANPRPGVGATLPLRLALLAERCSEASVSSAGESAKGDGPKAARAWRPRPWKGQIGATLAALPRSERRPTPVRSADRSAPAGLPPG